MEYPTSSLHKYACTSNAYFLCLDVLGLNFENSEQHLSILRVLSMNLLNAISEAGHPEIYQLLPFAKEFWLWVWLMGGGLTFLEGEDQMERGGGGGAAQNHSP